MRGKEGKLRMLPHWYLDEMGHTSHSSWKGIISAMLKQNHHQPSARSQRLCLHLHVNTDTDSHSSTSGEEELDDSEDDR